MAKEYVVDAVASYCGGLKPPEADIDDPTGDPMFELDRDSVKVTRLLNRRGRP